MGLLETDLTKIVALVYIRVKRSRPDLRERG